MTKNIDDGYLGSGLSIRRAIKKYGKHNFTREILNHCDTKHEMQEQETIALRDHLNNPLCYNLSYFGVGGNTREIYTPEQKQQYINKLINNPNCPIGKSGKNNHRFGSKWDKKYKQKRSNQMKTYYKELKINDPEKWQQWKDKVSTAASTTLYNINKQTMKRVFVTNKSTNTTTEFMGYKNCMDHFNISKNAVKNFLNKPQSKPKLKHLKLIQQDYVFSYTKP